MSAIKISQIEAKRLLAMTKRSLIAEFSFPEQNKKEQFDVVGDTKKDIFSIQVFRGKINPLKYNIGARIKKNGVILMKLHINSSSVHRNPNGEKIYGSHWHIYDVKYERGIAFPAEKIESEKFEENTIDFLVQFNVVERPEIHFQTKLA